ncbi:MAG TPA: bifunctional 4-hydroxy-2-oxoglutarate aldolase/2-dehydro-3-deoxy-phosphogluconate aldolase [Limnochordales bacterium]
MTHVASGGGVEAQLVAAGVVPVVRLGERELALRVAQALAGGGMQTVEVTFTVPQAEAIIAALRRDYPHLLVGAGTVRDRAEAARALRAGAHYLVSPGLVAEVLDEARRAGVLAIPGVLTPSEALQAVAAGCRLLKLFPASAVGPAYLKALRAVLPDGVAFCPTGGVELEHLPAWAEAGASLVGVGGPLLGDVERTGDLAGLARRAQAFLEAWRAACRRAQGPARP